MTRIALASSELTPFAKTGGLADVAAALTRHLRGRDHDVRTFVPLYRRIAEGGFGRRPDPRVGEVELPFGSRTLRFRLEVSTEGDTEGVLYFVDCPELFDRDEIYAPGDDDALRFALLSRAVLESCQRWGWAPEILHCNDWHVGLLPLYLKSVYAWDRLFEGTRSLLSLHNLGYQGTFPAALLDELQLHNERPLLHQGDLRDGHFSFLKTGLLWADMLSTVSETYAREIQEEEYGFGLHELLRARSDHLVGIVNGVDGTDWDPATDPHLPANYSRDDLAGKAECRRALLDEFQLAADPAGPVFGIVSRLTGQKGFELLPGVLPVLCAHEDVRVVVLGSGEKDTERYFQWLRDQHPTKVGFYRGYSEPLAHRIEAGADVFLMPSRYEPCGLNQMYSLKYGTIPLVRATGGLADTVQSFDPATRRGNGFRFEAFDANALLEAVRAALAAHADPEAWSALMQNAMAADWSWERQILQYEELYQRMLA